MSKEEKLCPKCGRKMSLVAAGWYCMRDDVLIDPVTGKPVEALRPRPVEARPPEIDRPIKTKVRPYDRSIDGDFPLICPIIVTAVFWSLEAIRSRASPSVYQYSFFAFMASFGLAVIFDRRAALVVAFCGITAPVAFAGFTGMELLDLGFLSHVVSVALMGFSRNWKRVKFWLAGSFLWVLIALYLMVALSLIAFTVSTFGLPQHGEWWIIIALYGLAGWFVRVAGHLHAVGAMLYEAAIYMPALALPPILALWAISTNLVVIYLRMLIPSIRKILTLKPSVDRSKLPVLSTQNTMDRSRAL